MNSSSLLQVEQSLRSVGFSRYEVQIMVYLFRVKKADLKHISQETAISQSMAQAALNNLVRKGLVIGEAGQSDLYASCSADHFRAWLRDERQRHLEVYNRVEEDLDGFFEEVEESSWQPKVLYYEGHEGLKEIYDDILETGQDIYTCTDMTKLVSHFGEDYLEEFINTRIEKDMHLYTIRSKDADTRLKSGEEKRNQKSNGKRDELRTIKTLENLRLDGEVKVYGDKCAIIALSKNEQPIGFVFQSKEIARLMEDLLKHYFN